VVHPARVALRRAVVVRMPRSKVLTIALLNLAIVATCLLILYMGTLQQPWDLIVIGLGVIGCPIGGLWFAVTRVRHDVRQGVSRWQTTIGILLAIGTFIYCLLLFITRPRRS
jgi:hypothetical protein